MSSVSYETILRAFRIFNGFDGPSSDGLWWRTDEEYAPVKLFVECNDLFYWGCSDCEELNDENIADLEAAAEDCKKLTKKWRDAHLLFCCRQRKMRPQKPYFGYIQEEVKPLFYAAGPERE